MKLFSSKIVHGHTQTVLLGNNMYIMTQAPEKEPCLPHGLHVVRNYSEMTTGSKLHCCSSQKPDSCGNYYWQGHQDHPGSSCK